MLVFVKTNEKNHWWVFCHDPNFSLGPFASDTTAWVVKQAIDEAYEKGKKDVQGMIKEALGL